MTTEGLAECLEDECRVRLDGRLRLVGVEQMVHVIEHLSQWGPERWSIEGKTGFEGWHTPSSGVKPESQMLELGLAKPSELLSSSELSSAPMSSAAPTSMTTGSSTASAAASSTRHHTRRKPQRLRSCSGTR